MRYWAILLCVFVWTLPLTQVYAATQQQRFTSWLATDLWPEAKRNGISKETFNRATRKLRLDLKLPDLAGRVPTKQRQSEFRSPGRYFNQKSISGLVKQGSTQLRRHQRTLSKIERRTGVPAEIIVSIWARESGYGRVKMPKNAIRSLATLSFMGNRKTLFRKELIAALSIAEKGHVAPENMGSSWAGALGQPQFLPSRFFDYAIDEDGDGRRDIWNSIPDTLGSIGNYLSKHGWKRGRDWGFEVDVPSQVSCTLGGPDSGRKILLWHDNNIKRIQKKRYPIHELKGHGYLLFPAGRHGPTFVTTPNFYVLKKYNESDVYALFVGHLADRYQGGKAFEKRWRKLPALSRSHVARMQKKLIALGYDVGGADGLVGYKTRTAIGMWQESAGLRATCFPGKDVTERLR